MSDVTFVLFPSLGLRNSETLGRTRHLLVIPLSYTTSSSYLSS